MVEISSALDILWSMPIEDRNVAFLHYCEGMNIDEIASVLNIKSDKASSQLSSARKVLKRYL